ncbi:hypothetical protein FACS1894184_06020 [Clostridia bacterium]|nr:hypothetical protein FACS1894184_06020 [Clostridia bacterium]
MRVLFDLIMAQPNTIKREYHGGGEYIKSVYNKLRVMAKNSDDIFEVFYSSERFMDGWLQDIISDSAVTSYNIGGLNEISKLMLAGDHDVFFSGLPYEYYHIIVPAKTKVVGTIHGL